MPTMLPTDDNNNPIPALRLRENGAHKITVTSVSARNTVPFGAETRVVSLYASAPVYLRFGSASVSATSSDHYLPAGMYCDLAIGGEGTFQTAYVAALRAETDCILYISEKV
jgi:hypothetical protein